MTNPKLSVFMNAVLALHVRDFNGAGAGIAGISSSGDVLLLDLKQSVAEFARELAGPGGQHESLAGQAEKIQGQLLTLAAAGVISHNEADDLIGKLQSVLVK